MKTTNYYNTFIEVAEDSSVQKAEVPPQRGETKSIVNLQYEIVSEHPYVYTSDDVQFMVHARRKGIPDDKMEAERVLFFSKGQPCFRSSPLTKRYGWGVHSDNDGKIALYAVESDEYQKFAAQRDIHHKKAMRSKRA